MNNINFNVYLNEIFAIIGHNGAGKSILMNIMTGMYYESSSSITYNGKNFKNNRSEICSDTGSLYISYIRNILIYFYIYIFTLFIYINYIILLLTVIKVIVLNIMFIRTI